MSHTCADESDARDVVHTRSRRQIAVVTGASSGLGEAFAKALDGRSDVDRLILVARHEAPLRRVQQALQTKADVCPLDLCETGAGQALADLLDPDETISWLVNNAGMGFVAPFDAVSADDHAKTVRLNLEAPISVTHALRDRLKTHSHVIMVASVAAFSPQPMMATYAATKAALLSWARALRVEWERAGIVVTTVCPNPVNTAFFDRSDGFSEAISGIKRIGVERADRVVAHALRQAERNKALAISHPLARVIHGLAKVMPTSWLLALSRLIGVYDV